MSDRITSHSIEFIRHGSCKRCGACEKPSCPHLTWKDGLATCEVYGEKEYFELNCHVFPDSPFCDVVLDGICAYTFEPVTAYDAELYEEMLEGVKQRRADRQCK